MLNTSNKINEKSSIPIDVQLWDVETVAEWLRTTKDRIREMAQAGEIPARKVGRLWRFRVSALLDWFIEGGRAQKKGDN